MNAYAKVLEKYYLMENTYHTHTDTQTHTQTHTLTHTWRVINDPSFNTQKSNFFLVATHAEICSMSSSTM